ncbi:MAG: phenylacetate-CoA oxygenase subunit PaaC [Phycisphaerales bacterium]|nr:phenylacetate-CoA oxygenase subunit PaaC [Phycisphaerales bacterium]
MSQLDQNLQTPMVELLLSLADDKLFLGHRNSDWTGIAPILEADIAFSSLAQDDIAHASAFYELIGTVNDKKSDQIAFGRTCNEYRCADIVTKSDHFNWANAIARQLYCNTFDYHRLARLSKSSWSPLSALSKRILAEQTIHVDHISTWIQHLGNGNSDSKARLQEALDTFAPYAIMLFEEPEGLQELRDASILQNDSDFYTDWKSTIDVILNSAGVTCTCEPTNTKGGRSGKHDEDFVRSLAELQEVFSTDPLAAW